MGLSKINRGLSTGLWGLGGVNGAPTTPAVAPVADFSGTPRFGDITLNVSFTDLSTNAPTSWFWEYDFDSGGWGPFEFSTSQNPTQTFDDYGTYSIRLTATNAAGSNTVTKMGYIEAEPPAPPYPAPWAYYPLTANANDASGNGRNLDASFRPGVYSATGGVVAGYTYPFSGYTYLDQQTQSTSPGSYTVAGWFRKPSTSAGQGVNFGWGGQNPVRFLSGTLTMPGYVNASIPDNTWVHTAVANNAGSAASYYNGSSVGSGSLAVGSYQFLIENTESYTGVANRICEVAIWKGTVLTALEIAAVYNKGVAGQSLV
jgi:PKD repeat protein